MSSLSIGTSARNAILDWFKQRGYLDDRDVARLLREDQGLDESVKGLRERVDQDFGSEAADAFVRALVALGSPPTVRDVLLALPDDWFARAVELAIPAHENAHAAHYVYDLLDSFPPPTGVDEMVNRVLKANRCPWELVDGKVQPLGDPATAVAVSARPTGWPEVDREVRGLVEGLRDAETPEDFNAIGSRALRLLITVGRLVDVAPYVAEGEIAPGLDDVKRRLAIFFENAAVGERFAQLRGPIRDDVVKRSYTQSEAVKHRRNADAVDAALAVSLTLTVVDLVRIVQAV